MRCGGAWHGDLWAGGIAIQGFSCAGGGICTGSMPLCATSCSDGGFGQTSPGLAVEYPMGAVPTASQRRGGSIGDAVGTRNSTAGRFLVTMGGICQYLGDQAGTGAIGDQCYAWSALGGGERGRPRRCRIWSWRTRYDPKAGRVGSLREVPNHNTTCVPASVSASCQMMVLDRLLEPTGWFG